MVEEVIVIFKMKGNTHIEDVRRVIDKMNETLKGLENSPRVKIIFN